MYIAKNKFILKTRFTTFCRNFKRRESGIDVLKENLLLQKLE